MGLAAVVVLDTIRQTKMIHRESKMRRNLARRLRFGLGNCIPTPKVVASILLALCFGMTVDAKDYFLVIGGGPNKQQNQASMEANVLFLTKVLDAKASPDREVIVYFADGDHPDADLQIIAPIPPSDTPVRDLLKRLHSRGPALQGRSIGYRNHQVPDVQGSTHVRRLERAIRNIGQRVQSGDRVFLYVTAHGSAGPRSNPQNTSIACWGSTLPASQLTDWLDEYPKEVPVISMMAQCYAGGFANTIFEDIEERKTLCDHARIGFYAQQYDLQAAGCRPDIERDEEFSSYFWGAIFGEMRNGSLIQNADLDGDANVSLEEAFVYTVCHGDTIDIPLRGSDLLLRQWSLIPEYQLARDRYMRTRRGQSQEPKSSEPTSDTKPDTSSESSASNSTDASLEKLLRFEGSYSQWLAGASIYHSHTVRELCRSLEIDLEEGIEKLASRFDALRQSSRGIGPNRRGRASSGRRELLEAIAKDLPELNNPETWEQSDALKSRDQVEWMAEIEKMPEFGIFRKRAEERQKADAIGEESELKGVKYRRLIETVETLVLEKNLSLVAPVQVQERYAAMRAMECSSLRPSDSSSQGEAPTPVTP
jgi:transcriptional regulator with XRE-family HTH domain